MAPPWGECPREMLAQALKMNVRVVMVQGQGLEQDRQWQVSKANSQTLSSIEETDDFDSRLDLRKIYIIVFLQ